MSKITQQNSPRGFYSNGIWNSIIWGQDGKPYRERLEILVIDNKDRVYVDKLTNDERGRIYRLPGGSSEETLSLVEAVIKEAEEEARLKVTRVMDVNVSHTSIYTDENRPKWHKYLKDDYDFEYAGVINKVFVGMYDGEHKGHIEEHDRDAKMAKNGKFYPINKIRKMLSVYHQDALALYTPRMEAKSVYDLLEPGDTVFNLDQWIREDEDIIYVLGISGSGKSTLGRRLSQSKKTVYVDMDAMETYLIDEIKKYTVEELNAMDIKDYYKLLLDEAILYAKGSKKPVVIEGIQLLYIDIEYLKKYTSSFVLKSSKYFKSSWNAIKRDKRKVSHMPNVFLDNKEFKTMLEEKRKILTTGADVEFQRDSKSNLIESSGISLLEDDAPVLILESWLNPQETTLKLGPKSKKIMSKLTKSLSEGFIGVAITSFFLRNNAYREEAFSDSFAAMFGYGQDVHTALRKFDDYFHKRYGAGSRNTTYSRWQIYRELFHQLSDPHPERVARIRSTVKYLNTELKVNRENLTPEMIKMIEQDIEALTLIEKQDVEKGGVGNVALRQAIMEVTGGAIDIREILIKERYERVHKKMSSYDSLSESAMLKYDYPDPENTKPLIDKNSMAHIEWMDQERKENEEV